MTVIKERFTIIIYCDAVGFLVFLDGVKWLANLSRVRFGFDSRLRTTFSGVICNGNYMRRLVATVSITAADRYSAYHSSPPKKPSESLSDLITLVSFYY